MTDKFLSNYDLYQYPIFFSFHSPHFQLPSTLGRMKDVLGFPSESVPAEMGIGGNLQHSSLNISLFFPSIGRQN